MAAEAIKKTAELMGHEIQVEVHGAEGTTNRLAEETIAAADALLIAADIHVETEPFGDMPALTVSTSRAIRDTQGVLGELLALVPGLAAPAATGGAKGARGSGGRRLAHPGCHRLPDRHRPHLHGCRSNRRCSKKERL